MVRKKDQNTNQKYTTNYCISSADASPTLIDLNRKDTRDGYKRSGGQRRSEVVKSQD